MIISNLDELTGKFRSLLIEVSQLDNQLVRNALSEYGTSLDKRTGKSIFESITNSDLLILFELNSDESRENYSMTELDGSISYFAPMSGKLIIYGKKSFSKASDIVAKLRTSTYRDKLISNGMYLDNVSKVRTLYEFQNNSLWNRADVSVDFTAHLSILPFEEVSNIESVDIKVKEYV